MANLKLNADHQPVIKLLQQCPIYEATRLIAMSACAAELGVAKLWVKDESTRMKLGSFKALGGSYAILELLRRQAGLAVEALDLQAPRFREVAAATTLVCATAGNHGLSVAAAARLFGATAKVFIAESVPESFALRLTQKNATVIRAGEVYADAMAGALAASQLDAHRLIADTSWQQYQQVPQLIYQGYTALAEECRESFAANNQWPSQVYLQAGVGGLAAAVAAHIRAYWSTQPEIVIVEPEAAPCLAASIAAGKMVEVAGPVSCMGRLDCKQPSLLAFESLRGTADRFIAISDPESQASTALLDRHGIVSTPSGTAGLAGLIKDSRKDAAARCLVIASEGSDASAMTH